MPRFGSVSGGLLTSALTNQNALVASTLSKVSRDLADNVFDATPFYWYMKKKNRVIPWSGGESMEMRLMYGKNPNSGAYSPYEVSNSSPPEGFGNAIYVRSYYRCPINYSRATLEANQGDAAVGKLVQDLKTQGELSLIDDLNTDLWSETDPTTMKSITPLPYIVEPVIEGNQDSTIGGISKSSHEWWRNKFVSCTGDGTGVETHLRKLFIQCKNGADKPDLGLCDDYSYGNIEAALFSGRRFVNATSADFGFDNINYRGCTIISDSTMGFGGVDETDDDGATFFLNTKYLRLAIAPGADFKFVAPEYDQDQDIFKGMYLLDIQLICNNLSRQGVSLGTADVNI